MTPDIRDQITRNLRAARSTLADCEGNDELCNAVDLALNAIELLVPAPTTAGAPTPPSTNTVRLPRIVLQRRGRAVRIPRR